MKNLKFTIFSILFIVFMTNCKNDNKSLLINKWNLITFSDEEFDINYNKKNEQIYEFLPDNSFTITNIKTWKKRTDTTISLLTGY